MTAIAPDAYLPSVEAAHLAGITYRQLNYIAIHLGWNPGSGSHRLWSHDQVRRIRIASALNETANRRDLPHFAWIVLNGPEPPRTGWVAYSGNTLTYGSSPAVALKGLTGGVVVKIPELGQ